MMRSVFMFLSVATVLLVLAAWPTSRAWADDPNDQNDQGDNCGTVITEDDDNQGDENTQGDPNGCGMVEVEVDDENGDQVDDMDPNGNPDDDVEVDVEETVRGSATVLHVQSAHNGSFRISGLPAGRAVITATRVHDGVTTSRTRKKAVREQRTKRLRLRLRPTTSP
jgi:hypothetical protein